MKMPATKASSGAGSVLWLFFIQSLTSFNQSGSVSLNCNQSFVATKDTPGVIHSYNYPFHYRDRLECHYHIFHEKYHPDITTKICFRFRRFSTERMDFLIIRAGLHNTEHRYHQDGQINFGFDSQLNNVWMENFCWSTRHESLNLTFTSNSIDTKPGFYAEFWLETKSPTDELLQNDVLKNKLPVRSSWDEDGVIPNTSAPCTTSQWPCFNRGCIMVDQKCDKVDSCGDSSDEMYSHAQCETGDFRPSLYACDFAEGSTCGFQGIATPGWQIVQANADPDRGPSADHTYGYPYDSKAQFARTVFGKPSEGIYEIGLKHSYIQLSQNTTGCLSFWYHMSGPRVGRLVVYEYIQEQNRQRPLWSRTGNYSDRWLHGEVLLGRGESNNLRQIIFEGQRTYDYQSSIALDDISLLGGELCRQDDISCNFEVDLCGWSNPRHTLRRRNGSYPQQGPQRDPVSADGDEMYAVATSIPQSGQIYSDQLVSPLWTHQVKGTAGNYHACLQIWLYMSDSSIWSSFEIKTRGTDEFTKIHKILRPENDNTYVRWRSRTWKEFAVDVHHNTPFQIIIELKAEDAMNEVIQFAVDEIIVVEGMCQKIELQSCLSTEFRCDNGYECIDMDLVCDGRDDCWDGSDEDPPACCYKHNCDPGDFCCKNGNCIFDGFVCNADNDCGDWSDEDICSSTCDHHNFHCDDGSRCILQEYRCDGHPDCGDNSDEDGCKGWGVLPTGAVAGIAIVIVIALIMILVRTVICAKKKPKCPRCLRCRRDSDTSSDEEEIRVPPPETTLFQQPPDYNESVNNPIYRRNLSQASSKIGDSDNDIRSTVTLPPAYERIEKGEYKTTVLTEKAAIHRLRHEIMAKSREALDSQNDSSSTIAAGGDLDDVQVEITENANGNRDQPNSNNTVVEINSQRTDGERNVNNTVIRRELNRNKNDRQRNKPVSRASSNRSTVSIPRYSELIHPPAYDNLSFCADESDDDTQQNNTGSHTLDVVPERLQQRGDPAQDPQNEIRAPDVHRHYRKRNEQQMDRGSERPESRGSTSLYRRESDRLRRQIHEQKMASRKWQSHGNLPQHRDIEAHTLEENTYGSLSRHPNIQQVPRSKSYTDLIVPRSHNVFRNRDAAVNVGIEPESTSQTGHMSLLRVHKSNFHPSGVNKTNPKPLSRSMATSMPCLVGQEASGLSDTTIERVPRRIQDKHGSANELRLDPRQLDASKKYGGSQQYIAAGISQDHNAMRRSKSHVVLSTCSESSV